MIPKFAVQWLKATSATGYLRQSTNPNLRVQDGPTLPLMCTSCENLLSRAEKAFAEKFWVPVKQGAGGPFPVVEDYRRFAISLAWRTVIAQTRFGDMDPAVAETFAAHAGAVDNAVEDWRAYLLGLSPSPGQYESNLFVLGEATDSPDEVRNKRINFYLRRGLDVALACDNSRVFAYTLLPGMAFWTYIKPFSAEQNVGTRLFERDVITSPQRNADPGWDGNLWWPRRPLRSAPGRFSPVVCVDSSAELG